MKIKITLLLLFILQYQINFGQQWQWARFLNYTASLSSSAEMTTDNNGNFYLKAKLDTTGIFEGIPVSKGTFIAKFNNAGVIQWAKSIPGAGKIKFNHQNILCVTGSFTGFLSFGSFSAISNGGSDIYIAQLDQNGTAVALKTFGGPGNDNGFGIDIGTDDRIFITGSLKDSVMFGSVNIKNMQNTQGFFAACVDAAFNTLWAVGDTLTGATGYDIVSDQNNNAYAWGQYTDTICYMYCGREFVSNFNNAGNKSFSLTGYQDGSFQNLETTGGSLFQYGYGCNHQYCTAYAAENDMQMNFKWGTNWFDTYHSRLIYGVLSANKESTVAGMYGSWAVQDSVDFDTIWVPLKGKNSDLMVTRLDSTGKYLWFKTAGGYWDEGIEALTADQQGNYFVFGWLSNYSGRADTLVMDNDVLIGNGSSPYQYFMARLATGGSTGIASVSKPEQDLRVYPNPSNGKFNIAGNSPYAICICNLYGEKIVFNQNGNEIDLTGQPAGIYHMEIRYPTHSVMRKLVLSK